MADIENKEGINQETSDEKSKSEAPRLAASIKINEKSETTEDETKAVTVKRTPNIPGDENKLYYLLLTIAERIRLSTMPTSYIDLVAFVALIVSLKKEIDITDACKTKKSNLAHKINKIITECNSKIGNLKGFLWYVYGKEESVTFYQQIGLVKTSSGSYLLPTNRKAILASLASIQNALTIHGYVDKNDSLAAWQERHDNFKLYVDEYNDNSGTYSLASERKKAVRLQINKALRSIINGIKSNYPDSYASVMRDYGFQKETL
jgi:hypothetical protein